MKMTYTQDIFYYFARTFCLAPFIYNTKNQQYKVEINLSYKVRFGLFYTTYILLTGYFRLYAKVLLELASPDGLDLFASIFFACAIVTVTATMGELVNYVRQRENITKLAQSLHSYGIGTNSYYNYIRTAEVAFIFTVDIMILLINAELFGDDTVEMVGNFLNELMIEMISFLDAFNYFNHVYLLNYNFKRVYAKFLRTTGYHDRKEVLKEYLYICNLARKFNRTYSLNIAFCIMHCFVWLMFDSYIFFYVLFEQKTKDLESFVRCVPWVVLHLFKLIIIVVLTPQCKKNAEKFKLLLSCICGSYRKCECLKFMIKFNSKLLNHKIIFMAHHWFVIDYILILKMISTISTYLAILYEFSLN